MTYHFSRCNRTEPWTSAKRETEPKSPDEGALPVPMYERRYRKAATLSAMLAVSRSCLGVQTGKGAPIGRFSCSPRYGGDRKAPLRPAIDRGGFGICESLSQCGNYRKTIRLARRNHKPGGADLAGSVHVVRSLSG